jgi:hypothetical protein
MPNTSRRNFITQAIAFAAVAPAALSNPASQDKTQANTNPSPNQDPTEADLTKPQIQFPEASGYLKIPRMPDFLRPNGDPYAEQFRQYIPKETRLANRFRRWQVESLLNQAATLMDQCIGDLIQYNSLRAAAQFLQNQIQKDKIDKAELDEKIRKGVFLREKVLAKADLDTLNKTDGGFQSTIDYANSATAAAGKERNGYETALAQQNFTDRAIEVIERTVASNIAIIKEAWAKNDEVMARENADDQETMVEDKIEQSSAFGALSFAHQSALAGERLFRNYTDAADRVIAASKGLVEIYGVNFGAPSFHWAANATTNEVVNRMYLWLRFALEWLVSYQQLEQSYTVVLSVRDAITDAEWSKLADGTVHSFPVSTEHFKDYENCRLRGIGAYIRGKAGIVPWSLMIRVPQKAIYIRNQKHYAIDQDEIPACRLGRVENQKSFRSVEICGAISLMNASPIGESSSSANATWSLQVLSPERSGEHISDVDDIMLELSLTGVPTSAGLQWSLI